MRTLLVIAVAAIGLAVLGCGGGELPSVGPELVAYVQQAQAEAEAAQAAGDAKAARKASDRAAKALKIVEKAAADNPADTAAAESLAAVKAAARAADYAAGLAEEEKDYAAKLGSFKARTYRLGRTAAIKAVFTSLALAADAAGSPSAASVPQEVKDVAQVAFEMAGGPKLPNGSPDWATVSGTMSGYASQPPAELPALLTIAMVAMGRNEFALYEADTVVAAPGATAYDQAMLIALRTFVLRINGYPKMASRLASQVPEGSDNAADLSKPEVQGIFCLLRAALAAMDKDYEQADIQLVQAMKVYPNNIVAVYLTGEVQVGEGQYEKAAGTMDDLIKSLPPDSPAWLLERVRDRARYLRDKKGEPEPLFTDKKFLTELVLQAIWESAKKSEEGRKVQAQIEKARAFGGQFLKYLPGGGKDEEKP
jgi:tetratricopeptide (TPR) repeat protein